jgi:hypothetical protein
MLVAYIVHLHILGSLKQRQLLVIAFLYKNIRTIVLLSIVSCLMQVVFSSHCHVWSAYVYGLYYGLLPT